MGWCSGTELFDAMADIVLPMLETADQAAHYFEKAIDAFTNKDWDCINESRYWEHPDFKFAVSKLFPDWDES